VETISRRIWAGVWGFADGVRPSTTVSFRSRRLTIFIGFLALLGIFEASGSSIIPIAFAVRC
jgi:hypothetical protein